MSADTAEIMRVFDEYQASVPFDGFEGADSGDIGKKWPFVKLESTLQPVQPFDFGMLPNAFAGFVQDAAHRMQSPPDYIAVSLMVSLSAVVGRKVAIHPKQKDNWLVVPTLWGAIIGSPSAKKTPSITEGIRAVVKLERDSKDNYADALSAYVIDSEIYDLEIKEGKAAAKKKLAENGRESAKEVLTAAQQKEPEKPIRKRYKTNSATVEKLGELLAQNPNGVLIIRDELAGFLAELDKPGHESDRAFYLEAWAGDSSFTYDRIGRGTLDIESACVSILGGTQPDKIKPLMEQAIKGGVGNDGFIQRFQMIVYPDKCHQSYIDDLPSQSAAARMQDVFTRIDTIDIEEQVRLRFSPDAQAHFIDWYGELMAKVQSPDIHPAIESHLSKYPSMVPSLALLIHLADSPLATMFSPVPEEAILKALTWTEYLESHMHRVYSLSDSLDMDNAISLARKFGKQLKDSFTLRDVAQANWKGLGRSTERAQAAISILLDNGYVIEANRVTDGRPTTDYLINLGSIGCHG